MKRKWILIAPSLVLCTSLVIGGGTYALFSSSSSNSNNTFTAGTLQIALDKQDYQNSRSAYFTLANMAPGDSQVEPVTISSTGSLALEYTMTITLGGFLGTDGTDHLSYAVYPTEADANSGTNPIALNQPRSLDEHGGAKDHETLYVKVTLPLTANNDYQGKSGTATITVNAVQTRNNNPVNHNIQSKEITNFDFSTSYASQANQRSKPMSSTSFSRGNAKSFTISDGTTTIPITLNWDIPLSGFSIGQVIGSAVESEIQQYYFDNGIQPASWTLNAGSYAADNTFNINSFQTGTSAHITLGGNDWSYFFQIQSYSGTNDDTSKNRSFTVSDGTHTATIVLNTQYFDMSNLVGGLNNQLSIAGISATANQVDATHFELVPNSAGITLTTGGINVSDFF